MASAVRKPTVVTEEDGGMMIVKVVVDGIKAKFLNKKKASNGDLEVSFEKQGFCLSACIEHGKSDVRKWELQIKRLPSPIDQNKSTWEVRKDLVVLSLHKVDDISWAPMLRRGLEQADSSDEED